MVSPDLPEDGGPCVAPPENQCCTCKRPPEKKVPQDYVLNNVQFLLSFGTRGGTAAWHQGFIGFQRAKKTCTALREKKLGAAKKEPTAADLDYCYIDAVSLPTKAGVFTSTDGKQVLNCWWQDYYKKAMHMAPKMAFLISKSWFLSKNCWQEWGWAIQENPNQRESKETLVIAVDAESKALLDAMEAGPGAPLDAAVHTFVTAPGVKSWFDGGRTTEAELKGWAAKMAPDIKSPPFPNLKVIKTLTVAQLTVEGDDEAKMDAQATALAAAIA
jgi:hypothetical protein